MSCSALRLAVVDADETDRRHTIKLLRRLGHWVDVDFEVAQFDDLAQARLDAVFLEVASLSAQEMEGVAAVAVAHPCPMVTMSSSVSDEVIDRANACHSFAHLVKPLGGDSLPVAVQLAVGRCAELRKLREEAQSLRQSLEDRKTIERAKGILMRSMDNDEAKAFKHLQQLARQSRRPLVEIAHGVIAVASPASLCSAPPAASSTVTTPLDGTKRWLGPLSPVSKN